MRYLLPAFVLLAACRPDFGAPDSLVTDLRILAVQATPAEVKPGDMASYRALIGSPSGTVSPADLAWAFCTAPKPLSENNVVPAACLTDDSIAPISGAGVDAVAATPTDACARFGPDVPPQKAGDPPLRPRDPDVTGGFYQPVRAKLGDAPVYFALERVTCNLPTAPPSIATQYAMQYQANRNPTLASVVATIDGMPADLTAVMPGQKVHFVATWPADSVETFIVFDQSTQLLREDTETMTVTWFATSGSFASSHVGMTSGTTSENDWTADVAGSVHVWAVLRDSRGGVDFLSLP